MLFITKECHFATIDELLVSFVTKSNYKWKILVAKIDCKWYFFF
jgi:hypothetical protein